jgi:Gram-negative bacterial TonB protein C-terminal
MTTRMCAVLVFVAAISITMAAQSEPTMISANIPKHPPLACQARIDGFVKLRFTLAANAAEPTNVEVVSGHAMLKGAAVENVNTWRFQNPYTVERKYETTFDYQLPSSGPQKVTFESFHRVEVATCLPVQWQP